MSVFDQHFLDRVVAFKTDPLAFILWCFPWGEPGELEKHELEDWQRGALIELGEFLKDHEFRKMNKFDLPKFRKAMATGHRTGKSALLCMLIIFFMSTRPYCRGVITANTGDQLRTKTWPELQKWHSRAINKDWFIWSAETFRCCVPKDEKDQVNWQFNCTPFNPENPQSIAGLHSETCSVIMFDEASPIPASAWEVMSGVMADPLVCWFVFGNPTLNTGTFRECFGEHRDIWRPQHIDSRTCKLNQFSQGEYAQEIKQYGLESDRVKVRILGQFPDTSDKQFISSKVVEDAQQRQMTPDPMAPLIMGVDPARFGADKFVIRWRCGRDGRSIPAVKYRNIDTMEAANRVAALIDKYDPDAVCIDAAGAGVGLIDRLRQMGYKVHEVWFGNKIAEGPYANTRARYWGEMREWLIGGMIDADKDLRDDMIGPEYSYNPQGQYLLESKENMKARGLHSPDDADALACTFAVNVARRDKRTSRHRGREARMATGIDSSPFT